MERFTAVSDLGGDQNCQKSVNYAICVVNFVEMTANPHFHSRSRPVAAGTGNALRHYNACR